MEGFRLIISTTGLKRPNAGKDDNQNGKEIKTVKQNIF
jgi:hypothetical protein